MVWFAGSVVSNLNSVLELKSSTEIYGIISGPEEVRWSRLRYVSHLQRMDTNVLPRTVNNYVVLGILPRWRPHLRWGDVITKHLKYINIRKELAHKRVEWRRAILPRKILWFSDIFQFVLTGLTLITCTCFNSCDILFHLNYFRKTFNFLNDSYILATSRDFLNFILFLFCSQFLFFLSCNFHYCNFCLTEHS